MLLSVVRPIAKLIGKLHVPFSRKKITAKDFEACLELMQPGDILLTRTRGELTNLFIPGEWPHAAIVVSDGLIVEAVERGVVSTKPFDFFRKRDFVKLIRPEVGEIGRKTAALKASLLVGRSYDYNFHSENEEYYCSELVNTVYNYCFKQRGAIVTPSDIDVGVVLYSNKEK